MCQLIHILGGRCLVGEREHRIVPAGIIDDRGGALHISRDHKYVPALGSGVGVWVTHEWLTPRGDMTSTWHFDGPPADLGGAVSDALDELETLAG